MLLNDVTNGGEVALQWKESRVVLVYKACDISELKNSRPIANRNDKNGESMIVCCFY